MFPLAKANVTFIDFQLLLLMSQDKTPSLNELTGVHWVRVFLAVLSWLQMKSCFYVTLTLFIFKQHLKTSVMQENG